MEDELTSAYDEERSRAAWKEEADDDYDSSSYMPTHPRRNSLQSRDYGHMTTNASVRPAVSERAGAAEPERKNPQDHSRLHQSSAGPISPSEVLSHCQSFSLRPAAETLHAQQRQRTSSKRRLASAGLKPVMVMIVVGGGVGAHVTRAPLLESCAHLESWKCRGCIGTCTCSCVCVCACARVRMCACARVCACTP